MQDVGAPTSDDVEFLGRLGRGSTSAVWRVRLLREIGGLHPGAVAALKVGRSGQASEGSDAGGEPGREAVLAARIEHGCVAAPRGVLHVRDGAGRSVPALLMEIAEGRSLAARLAADGPLPEADLRRVARHALAALSALHDRRIVHRDVKPDNLVEGPDGVVRLVDFGLALDLATATGEDLSGTLPYAAPEQILGAGAVDGRADLYALGATLFDLAAGSPPFGRSDSLSLLRRQVSEAPRALRATGASVSEGFESFVASLLEKDPDARPRDAREALAAMEGRPIASRGGPASGAPAAPSPRAEGPVEPPLPLVGRGRESAALADALSAAVAGTTIAVVGEARAGKTRFVAEALAGRAHGWAKAGADDAATLLSDLLRGLVLGPGTGGVSAAFAGLPALAPVARRLLRGERPPAAVRLATACLRTALAATAGAPDGPRGLVVDDAHALTAAEAEALRDLRADPGPRPWVLVAVGRDSEASAAARELFEDVAARIEMGRLSETDVDALAEAAGASRVARRFLVPRLSAGTGGIAGLVVGALRQLRGAGAFDAGEERWAAILDPVTGGDGGDPARIAGDLLARVDAESRAVLEAASVLGQRFDPRRLLPMLGTTPVRLLRRLAVLEHEVRVLVAEGDAFRFDPASLADALRDRVPEERRRAWHSAAADASADDEGARLHHLARAGRGAEALPAAAAVVDGLRAAGRPEAALRLADEVLESAPADARRTDRFLLRLARLRALQRLPGRDRVEAAFADLVGDAERVPAEAAVPALWAWAQHLRNARGDLAGAWEALGHASRLCRGPEAAEARVRGALRRASILLALPERGDRRRRYVRAVRRLTARVSDPALSDDADTAVAHHLLRDGDPAGATRLLAAVARRARARGDVERAGAAADGLCRTLHARSRYDLLLVAADRAIATARAAGDPALEGRLAVFRGAALNGLGRHGSAIEALDEAAPLLRAFGERRALWDLELARSWACGEAGREAESFSRLSALAVSVEPKDPWTYRWWLPLAAALTGARLGERRAVADLLRRARRVAGPDPRARLQARLAAAYAEAREGRFLRAAAHARRGARLAAPEGQHGRTALVLAAAYAVRGGRPDAGDAARAWEAVRGTRERGLRALAACALALARPTDGRLAARALRCARGPATGRDEVLAWLVAALSKRAEVAA